MWDIIRGVEVTEFAILGMMRDVELPLADPCVGGPRDVMVCEGCKMATSE
jgi:hypothetical protein